jgi:hypothetical protein
VEDDKSRSKKRRLVVLYILLAVGIAMVAAGVALLLLKY